MKRIYCKDCKWATNRWNDTGLWFCRATIELSWSWVKARQTESAKQCETVNVDGQCALYLRRWSFWRWLRHE